MNLGALFSDNPQVVVPGWFLKMTGWFLQIYYFILVVLEVKIVEKTLYFFVCVCVRICVVLFRGKKHIKDHKRS